MINWHVKYKSSTVTSVLQCSNVSVTKFVSFVREFINVKKKCFSRNVW